MSTMNMALLLLRATNRPSWDGLPLPEPIP